MINSYGSALFAFGGGPARQEALKMKKEMAPPGLYEWMAMEHDLISLDELPIEKP